MTNILIVDDEKDIRELIGDILKDEGYTTRLAANSDDCMAEINAEAWATLNSDTSRPFDKPKSGRIAVKVINHLGDEVMKVFRV